MAYPDFPQLLGSERIPVSGIMFQRTQYGRIRQRALFQSSVFEFVVVHELDTDQYDTLMTHYEANKSNFFNFRWQGDGKDYSVCYKAPPKERWLGGNVRQVTVQLGAE